MKVHYFNILLFALPLNILVNTHKKNTFSTHHTKNYRSLFECDLYMPANYDNDPQMKEVMENFNKQTQERFHEYDDRMKTNRQKCKDKCDKEIQNIILTDKLEKQMAQQLTTLETKIDTNDIPTCVCEKSMADKVEKGCLRCGYGLGTVAPNVGLLGGIGIYVLNAWKPLAITAAKDAAKDAATALATQEGMKAVILKIEKLRTLFKPDEGFVNLISIVKESTYKESPALVESARKVIGKACKNESGRMTSFYTTTIHSGSGEYYMGNIANVGATKFEETLTAETPILQARYTAAVDAKYGVWHTANIAPIIAIVVIVLIMVIIYLILHYRRKKKMKKKLQYIKLLEE
ncbi:rifin PIR protein, putative [Plasmodium reichenowi]|uniref:Rifin PIR protein, putative n=1 Tax=Plasmodium reichenowi TaxID=5854 RepID=A0A2P9DCM3_PLARE|nr:rifin PIR protein, putative [Plasmodium reichenowi]SOV78689.1 rifin PIR protein, putative [Plasmodium reichenowi]